MGNPLSPVVADFVMEMLLNRVVNKLGFPIPLLKKYVDDLILALPEDKISETLACFNSFHNNIQFTCEVEVDGRIPFLDMVLVRKADQTIKTEWYSKPMASGRFLDYLSHHPLHMKMNVVMNFIRRVRDSSTNISRKQVDGIILKHLKQNHYPLSLSRRLVNQNFTTTAKVNVSEDRAVSSRTPKMRFPWI